MKRLQKLLERRRQTADAAQRAREALYVAAYNACDVEGASREEVAKALGVSKATVQRWVVHGRQLRER